MLPSKPHAASNHLFRRKLLYEINTKRHDHPFVYPHPNHPYLRRYTNSSTISNTPLRLSFSSTILAAPPPPLFLLASLAALISWSSLSLASNSLIHASFFSFAFFSATTSSNSFRFCRSVFQYMDPTTMATSVKPWAKIRARNIRFVRLWSPARMERVAPRRAAQVRRQPIQEERTLA